MHADHPTGAPGDGARQRAARRRRWRAVIGIVLVLVLGFVALWSVVLRSYVNEGDGMLPGIDSGDRLIVNRLAGGDTGDVVVALLDGRLVVKRVVAVAGDTIAYVECRVVRNGVPVAEPYDTIDEPCTAGSAEVLVPEGEVFLMGDNRPGSADSRAFGPVRAEDVIGVVVATL